MDTIVLGGGLCGLAAGLMLSRDGHRVTVLERDAAPVPHSEAWSGWRRDGVVQFRQPHFLQARGRQVLESELPDVHDAFEAAGALRLGPVDRMPASIADRGARPGDERLVTLTARRPLLEQVLARAAAAELDVRRGAQVSGLEVRGSRVVGVRVGDERLLADLVIDAMGRSSTLPKLLGRAVEEEAEDGGYVYYSRFFRSPGGLEPRTAPITHVGSFSILTIPGEAGTWSVTVFTSAGDRPLKRLREPARFTALVRACREHAYLVDGEPITDVLPMAGTMNRLRRLNGTATGVASVGDAWACTNPSLGRGMALGLMHVALLRRVIRSHGGDPDAFARAWDEATQRELAPWYRASVAVDRARLTEIDAARRGRPVPAPADRAARVRAALPLAMTRDADAFRAGLEISNCVAMPSEVLARPGLAERIVEAAEGAAPTGPTREEVLRLVA
jgi:2-polyprenyl-6-methoxyphenol hydroxylase-like FAD-dependent oxidoreductase